MLTLWNRDKGGCSSEKPRQALQGSGLPEAAPQSFSSAPRTGESETDGGLGLFPKLRETAFTLTLVAEGGSGDEEAPHCGCRGCPPTSPPPAAPFPSPSPVLSAGPQGVQWPLRTLTAGAVGTSGASADERRGRRARGRQRESRQPLAAAGSLPIPAGLGRRTPRVHRGRMSQARGRAVRAEDALRRVGGAPNPAPEGRRRPRGGGRAAACARRG